MKHHIILISIDALRADRLGCQGHPAAVSPHIDSLARESLRMANASSPTTWTLPGHMSMLSGLEPPVHGCVSSHIQYAPDSLPFPLLFELLKANGYATQAVVGGGFMEARFGFGRDVDDYDVVPPIQPAIEKVVGHAATRPLTFTLLHTYMVHDYPRISTRVDPLRRVNARDPDYAGFFPTDKDFIHLLKALAETDETPTLTLRDRAYINDLYLSAIQATDTALKVLFNLLQFHQLWNDTTLIITSDHGESLGDEHSGYQYWFHGGPPYKEQLHVPLIIHPARHRRDYFETGVFEEPASIMDLAPTILDMLEIPYRRDQFDGMSLVDLCAGQVAAFETRRLWHHSCEDTENPHLPERLFGVGTHWKDTGRVVFNPRTQQPRELFWLDRDPEESLNQLPECSERDRDRMVEIYGQYTDRLEERAFYTPGERFEDNKLLARLAELGYIDA